MATTFNHQRKKAKGFCNRSELYARPTIVSFKFDYVGLFHLLAPKRPTDAVGLLWIV